jgi:hypothetical protein
LIEAPERSTIGAGLRVLMDQLLDLIEVCSGER